MEMMTLGKFRHLPVVEDGRVVGLISIGDIVKWRVSEYEAEQAALRDYIKTPDRARSGRLVDRPGGENVDRLLDRLDGALGGARAMFDQIIGTVKIEPADLTDARRESADRVDRRQAARG